MTKVFSEQYGCSASLSDNEMMLGLLKESGFEIVNSPDDSDLNIIVTCSVKVPTTQRMIYRIKELTNLRKPLIVAGCMTKTERQVIEKINPRASLISPDSIGKIVDVVRNTLNGKKIILLDDIKNTKLDLPRCRKNSVIGITQISRGCLCNCGFCIEPYKGKLFSYSQDVVVNDVKSSIKEGCKEIWLTSLDCGCYGFDNSTSLPKLLNSISKINEKFFVRIGMSNPVHIKKILDELIESHKNEKIFKFLHMPIQSFSDNVLEIMKRNYDTDTVTKIIKNFYKEIPDTTFSTDIIVGFPGEDESDFEMSCKFVEKFKPDIVNISKFGAHKSLRLKQLPNIVVDNRSKDLFELVKKVSLEKNQKWIDWEGEIIVDEKGTKDTWIGRNFAYKPIVIENKKNIFGNFVKVKIDEAKINYLIGKLDQ